MFVIYTFNIICDFVKVLLSRWPELWRHLLIQGQDFYLDVSELLTCDRRDWCRPCGEEKLSKKNKQTNKHEKQENVIFQSWIDSHWSESKKRLVQFFHSSHQPIRHHILHHILRAFAPVVHEEFLVANWPLWGLQKAKWQIELQHRRLTVTSPP